MRIGINALYLIPGAVGGTEVYLRSLLAALAEIDRENTYVIFTNQETGGDLVPNQPNFEWAPAPVRAVFRPFRILWEQFLLPLSLLEHRIDVLLNPGFTGPVLAPCEQVTVFHDLQHKRHPEYFRWFELPFWRLFLYLSAMRSRHLIAVSRATRSDLLAYYRLRPSKVRVVRHGVDPQMFEIGRRRNGKNLERYLLCVSTLHAHKNLNRLVSAFRRLHNLKPDFRLILAGCRGFYADELERQVKALGLEQAVEITGWVERRKLYELFERAWAFVYPSSFEGFGMPVTEALAAGVPTACSAIEPLISLSGQAALHFDPDDEDALFEALLRLSTDEELRRWLSAKGPVQAAQYSWKEAARKTLDVLLDRTKDSTA